MHMKQFLAVFLGSEASNAKWNDLPEEERAARREKGIAAWYEWMNRHKAAIVDPGALLGKTKRISASGVADVRNDMMVYTMVRAESHKAAAQMFADHPHFTTFHGDTVDLMECLPYPQTPQQ